MSKKGLATGDDGGTRCMLGEPATTLPTARYHDDGMGPARSMGDDALFELTDAGGVPVGAELADDPAPTRRSLSRRRSTALSSRRSASVCR